MTTVHTSDSIPEQAGVEGQLSLKLQRWYQGRLSYKARFWLKKQNPLKPKQARHRFFPDKLWFLNKPPKTEAVFKKPTSPQIIGMCLCVCGCVGVSLYVYIFKVFVSKLSVSEGISVAWPSFWFEKLDNSLEKDVQHMCY